MIEVTFIHAIPVPKKTEDLTEEDKIMATAKKILEPGHDDLPMLGDMELIATRNQGMISERILKELLTIAFRVEVKARISGELEDLAMIVMLLSNNQKYVIEYDTEVYSLLNKYL